MDPQRPDRGPGALAGLEALERRSRRPEPPTPTAPPVQQAPQVADPYAAYDPWTQTAAPQQPAGVPVPRRTRSSVRAKGPFVALLLPAVFGVIALVLLGGSTSTGRGVAGFLFAMLAAPLLPAFGAPLRSGSGAVTGAVVASAALWFVLGAFAGRRATRTPFGGWGRFWGEYLWLASCVWLGAVLAAVASNLVLGRVLV
jgi:hypothetical protein